MGFVTKRCRMVSPVTGESCGQPSLTGKEYCRFHVEAGEAGREANAENEIPDTRASAAPAPGANDRTPDKKPRRGARSDNRNARRHGLFSSRMPTDEKELYEENKRKFTEQLTDLNAFDELVVHLLALVAAKLDLAAIGGASAQSIIPLSNELLRLLRSLRETRDSRDDGEAGAPKTFADFLAEAHALAEAQGVLAVEADARKRVVELETQVNELRSRLNLPPQEDIPHRKTICGCCRKETPQHLNLAGEWICLACGNG